MQRASEVAESFSNDNELDFSVLKVRSKLMCDAFPFIYKICKYLFVVWK